MPRQSSGWSSPPGCRLETGEHLADFRWEGLDELGRYPCTDKVPGRKPLSVLELRIDAGIEEKLSGLRRGRSAAPFGEGVKGCPAAITGLGMRIGPVREEEADDVRPRHEGGDVKRCPVLSRRDRQVWIRAVLEQGRNRRGRSVGGNGCMQDSP